MKSQHTKQAHLQTAQANTQTKVCKRACFSPNQEKKKFKKCPTAQQKTMKNVVSNRPTNHGRQGSTGGNTVLPKWRQKCYYETFVQGSTFVLLLNFSAKNPPLRQYPKRYASL